MTPNPLTARTNLRPPSPLRCLRVRTGLKRGAFAARIGVSYDTVKKVEYGQIAISPDVAIRTMLAFGVKPESLIESSVAPLDLSGKKYTEQAYHAWQAKIPRDPDFAADEIKAATDQLRAFLEVCCRHGRLPAARAVLGRFLWSATTDLGIALDYGRELKKAGVPAGKNLAGVAKAAGERLLEKFQDSRVGYKTYMQEDFPRESAKLHGGKTRATTAAYRRLTKMAAKREDVASPRQKRGPKGTSKE